MKHGVEEASFVSGSDFAVEPENGTWLSFPPQFINIYVLNSSFDVVVHQSSLTLDGESLHQTWDPFQRLLQYFAPSEIGDGLHSVEARVTAVNQAYVDLTWHFGLDRKVPDLIIEPLPAVTEDHTVEVRGIVEEERLVKVEVGGQEVPVVDGEFSAGVQLWPGPNDVLVEAFDLAGNLGRHTSSLRLLIGPPTVPMTLHNHTDASFTIQTPDTWVVARDLRLVSGEKAAIFAVGPLQPGIQTNLIVTAHRTVSLSRERARQWMDLLIAEVEANEELRAVVSRTRFVDSFSDAQAVQASFLRQDNYGSSAFIQLTMIWNNLEKWRWVILASMDTRRVYDEWTIVNASVSSFTPTITEPPVIEEPPVLIPLTVTVGASVFLVAILLAVLLEAPLKRWTARRRERWKPPKSWRMRRRF